MKEIKKESNFEIKNNKLDEQKINLENFTQSREDINNELQNINDVDKEKIKDEKGWSDNIIDSLHSMKEYEIYKKADLKEFEINNKSCLIRNVDFEKKDSMGRTNKERMEKGYPPIDENGRPIELHHIGQKSNSPLAELTINEHRGKGNDVILHNKKKESEIDRLQFSEERKEHWKKRSEL